MELRRRAPHLPTHGGTRPWHRHTPSTRTHLELLDQRAGPHVARHKRDGRHLEVGLLLLAVPPAAQHDQVGARRHELEQVLQQRLRRDVARARCMRCRGAAVVCGRDGCIRRCLQRARPPPQAHLLQVAHGLRGGHHVLAGQPHLQLHLRCACSRLLCSRHRDACMQHSVHAASSSRGFARPQEHAQRSRRK